MKRLDSLLDGRRGSSVPTTRLAATANSVDGGAMQGGSSAADPGGRGVCLLGRAEMSR
jgi:hypothetical protein